MELRQSSQVRARALAVLARLRRAIPDAKCDLDFHDAFSLLVATILSAQCTDERVNQVTPELLAEYPTARALARADVGKLERIIKSTGFFRNKARNLVACARALEEHHGGQVPADLHSLVSLPGVGRKTANVVLGVAFGRPEGVVVDTHVSRLSRRLGLTNEKDPGKIEADLNVSVPRKAWRDFPLLLIQHGRKTCSARKPACSACVIGNLCPSAGKDR